MRCDEALEQLNARRDGELPIEEIADLDTHLAECATCRTAAKGLDAIDVELRRAFDPRREAAARLAESTAAHVRSSTVAPAASNPAVATTSAAPARRLAWGQMLVALAAGFLLAVVLLRPWRESSESIASALPTNPVAHVSVASGLVEVQMAGQIPVLMCPASTPLQPDSIVRTGATQRCEIALEAGNSLCLDRNTEVKLRDPEVVEMNRGRLFTCSEPEGKGIEIRSAGGKIVASPDARLSVDCQSDSAARLIVLAGQVEVQTGAESIAVAPGKQARIAAGKVELDPQASDGLLETSWVNSVLAMHSSDHPELVERVQRLLASVGAAKLSLLYEDELRRLGDDGVPPLLAYLNSTRDTPEREQRATAARIVADVAQAQWTADLIELLTDPNADVRFHAARGLERLTGRNHGVEAQAWRSAPWASCENAHQKWLAWWAENRDRYPPAHLELAAPVTPPF